MTPPYASDTRAKGWRFELDYEQIEQSSTWALASAEAKPWLLMLWFTAWKQVPCGSLPADEQVIAALIGIAPKVWQKHSKVLLRGWSEVGGRLYHDTLARRVHEMMTRRRSDSDRKAAERARKAAESAANPPGVTPESHVTPTGLHRESSTGTDNLLPQEIPPSGVRGPKASKRCPADFKPEAWEEMQAKCPGVSLARETEKFRDWEFKRATSDWQAAWRRWMRKAFDELRTPAVLSFKERDAAASAARVREMTGGLMDVSRDPLTIEMETPRAAQIGNR